MFSMYFVIHSYIRRGESHWWMKGSTPPQIAEIIIKLVKDMAAVSSIYYNLSFETIFVFCFSCFHALYFTGETPLRYLSAVFLRATCQMLGPESPKTQ